MATSRMDVVQLPYLVAGSLLHQLGLASGRVVTDVADLVPVARLSLEQDWDVYRGTSNRKAMSKRVRRLERLGNVTRRELVAGRDDHEFEPLVDWLLEHRRRRGEVTGRDGVWLRSDAYRDFLVASLRDTDVSDPLSRLFLVELGNTPIAVVTMGIGPAVAHTEVTAFDADYAAHSPGLLAFEQAGRWAIERGLDLNMGPGGEAFKLSLARGHTVATSSLTLALTRRARLAFGARGIASRLRSRGLSGTTQPTLDRS
jgi:CelD/BcsL family acetyltransferase involved in cellulose biosynthesis